MNTKKHNHRLSSQPAILKMFLMGAAVIGGAAAVYASKIEPEWLNTRYIQLKLPRLSPDFHDYRIAHISDIHMGEWMTRKRLESVVNLINQLQPDMVVITGDFVSRYTLSVADDLIGPLSALKAVNGTFAVLGNHDHSFSARGVRSILARSGITELRNAVHTLQRGDAMLHIAGIDDVIERKDRLDAVLDQLPDQGAAILLSHEPDFANISAATGRFDLQLSGHSHGGQVRVPFLGMPILPSHGRLYPSGLYQVADMYQFTNRGLGMIAPYVRFNAMPELTILILESDK